MAFDSKHPKTQTQKHPENPTLIKDVKGRISTAELYVLALFKDAMTQFIAVPGSTAKKPMKFYDIVKGKRAVLLSRVVVPTLTSTFEAMRV
jgi:hypothetical protein